MLTKISSNCCKRTTLPYGNCGNCVCNPIVIHSIALWLVPLASLFPSANTTRIGCRGITVGHPRISQISHFLWVESPCAMSLNPICSIIFRGKFMSMSHLQPQQTCRFYRNMANRRYNAIFFSFLGDCIPIKIEHR